MIKSQLIIAINVLISTIIKCEIERSIFYITTSSLTPNKIIKIFFVKLLAEWVYICDIAKGIYLTCNLLDVIKK